LFLTKRNKEGTIRPLSIGQFGCFGAIDLAASDRKLGVGLTIVRRECAMKTIFTAVLCAASLAFAALSPSAVAEQKTAKQCNDDWTADKAAIQASGKTKRVFVAECRGLPVTAAAPKALTLGKGQYATEAEAKASCPTDTVVWVNLRSMIYHASGSRNYGQTKQGAYMCEQESVTAGFHAPKPRGPAAGAT
jgi:hypothetical protein